MTPNDKPQAPAEKIQAARHLVNDARNEVVSAMRSVKDHERGDLIRQIHTCTNMLALGEPYFSQAGQDRIIDSLLKKKMGGVFVDVGGYDGREGSNSLFFEVFRAWSGILIEAAPTQLAKAQAFRRCPCIGAGVAGTPGQMEFMEITGKFAQLSGFLDSYSPKLLKFARAQPDHNEIIHTLESRTLADILSDQKIVQADFLSLDVEGGEVGILESFPFSDFDIDIWSIENNTRTPTIRKIMHENGYKRSEFAGVDEIYRRVK
jgi:FkbM family methyltransferase